MKSNLQEYAVHIVLSGRLISLTDEFKDWKTEWF